MRHKEQQTQQPKGTRARPAEGRCERGWSLHPQLCRDKDRAARLLLLLCSLQAVSPLLPTCFAFERDTYNCPILCSLLEWPYGFLPTPCPACQMWLGGL